MSTRKKKSTAHVHSYLMLISLFFLFIIYLFIYYVCQIATTYLKLKGVMHQKKQHDTFELWTWFDNMILKKSIVHAHLYLMVILLVCWSILCIECECIKCRWYTNHMFMWGKSIHSDKYACTLVKKSSAHMHWYLMLILHVYWFILHINAKGTT